MAELSALFPGKQFISTVIEALEAKTAMSGELTRRYLMRSAMAGIAIGVMYLASSGAVAAFAASGTPGAQDVGRLVGGLVFGFALVFIYYSKSELLTSNMMIVSIGSYYHRTSTMKAMRILVLCFLGNALGGLLMAVLLRPSTLLDGPGGDQMRAAAEHKLEYVSAGLSGWGDLFVRAVLCNFMINLAMLLVYNGRIKEDLTKSLVMVVAVFVFMFLGFEHSVANTVLFTILGLWGEIDLGLAVGNVTLALLGNFVGGGVLIGLYYAYINDDAQYLREHGVLPPGRS